MFITHLVNIFLTSFRTWSFSPVFTRTHYWTLPWASLMHSTPSHLASVRSVLIIFSHPSPGIWHDLFSWDCVNKILCVFFISPMYTICPAWFYHHSNWWIVQIMKLIIIQFSQSVSWGPNNFPSSLFSNRLLSVMFLHNEKPKFAPTWRTGKIIISCVLVLGYIYWGHESKYPIFDRLLPFLWMWFWFLTVRPHFLRIHWLSS